MSLRSSMVLLAWTCRCGAAADTGDSPDGSAETTSAETTSAETTSAGAGTEAASETETDATGSTGALPADGPVYAVHLVDVDDDPAILTCLDSRLDLAATWATSRGAQWVGSFSIEGDLESPGLPTNTSAVAADRLWVAAFADVDTGRASLQEDLVLDDLDGDVRRHVAFVGQTPPPFAIFGPLQSTGWVSESDFLLLNAIALAPDGQADFDAYTQQAVPMAMAAGTEFAAPVSPVEVLEGDFDFHFLSLTRWVDQDAFEQLHASPAFLSISPLRDAAVVDFVEARARPRPVLKLDVPPDGVAPGCA